MQLINDAFPIKDQNILMIHLNNFSNNFKVSDDINYWYDDNCCPMTCVSVGNVENKLAIGLRPKNDKIKVADIINFNKRQISH